MCVLDISCRTGTYSAEERLQTARWPAINTYCNAHCLLQLWWGCTHSVAAWCGSVYVLWIVELTLSIFAIVLIHISRRTRVITDNVYLYIGTYVYCQWNSVFSKQITNHWKQRHFGGKNRQLRPWTCPTLYSLHNVLVWPWPGKDNKIPT